MRRSDHTHKKANPPLLLALLALFAALAIAAFSMLDRYGTFHRWRHPPVPPLEVEAIVPARAAVQRVPEGAVLSPSGWLTILRVPPTPAQPSPIVERKSVPSATAAGPDLDAAVAGGVRAFFRTRPQPRNDRLTTTTLEYKYTQLRLVLADGCFRAHGPGGPLVVFPPGARLFLDGNYLSVGVPGAPDTKARVGEELYWEAYAAQISHPKSVEIVHSICGPGAVLQVVPSSASVLAARQDSGAAFAFQRSSQGLSWADAVRALQDCDRRMEAAIRRDNPRAPEVLVSNMCGSSLANPPDPGNCPRGTRFDRGNCLDAKGRVAPVAAEPPPAPPN